MLQYVRPKDLKKVMRVFRLKIKEVAEEKGYNISTLSRDANIPFNTLRRAWRNPTYEIKLGTLHKIAQTLGVQTRDLIEDVPDNKE